MRPPFGSRAERRAQERATDAEVARLCSLSAAELAEELMAAFGPDGAHAFRLRSRELNLIEITEWTLRGHAFAGRHLRAIHGDVRASLRLLERRGLVAWRGSDWVGAKARISTTALGEVALRDRSVARPPRGRRGGRGPLVGRLPLERRDPGGAASPAATSTAGSFSPQR